MSHVEQQPLRQETPLCQEQSFDIRPGVLFHNTSLQLAGIDEKTKAEPPLPRQPGYLLKTRGFPSPFYNRFGIM